MDVHEIVKLRRLLHENGDKVLSASSKLSLSSTLLYDLNEGFTLITNQLEDLESSFQVCSSSMIDLFEDLKFLHDFVQKTVGLKVTYWPNNPLIPVDISKFRHLKHLELKKINIKSVKGLQGVRGQLESIICSGRNGVSTVKQLLAKCGGDASFGFVWSSLIHLALPYNALKELDESMELALWLQRLDLSHNLITSADQLASLPNLKYVNLGYNKLETIPAFNKAVSHTLQVLVLKNNYIENLNGLQNLGYLKELDVSFNCLMDHSTLRALEKITTLVSVSLEGNPLSYHPKHRLLCMQYLHSSLMNVNKFVLDHLPLSRTEKQTIAYNQSLRTMRFEQSASFELPASVPNSMNSSILSTSINSSTLSEDAMGRSMETITGKPLIKTAIVKEAVISEDEHKLKETSKLHLETKKQILDLREKFGEKNWLKSYGGIFVQDMGLEPSPYLTLTPESAIKIFEETEIVLNAQQSETPSTINLINNSETGTSDSVTEYNECNSIEETHETSNKLEETVSATTSTETTVIFTEPESPYNLEEETGDLYLVQKNKNDHELENLFLIITANDIKERDSITGKLLNSWSMSSVLSCALGRSEPVTVDIVFDTTRETRRNKRYIAEPEDAKKIVTILEERLKKRPISLKVFKCMKCSTHFSEDTEYVTTLSIGAKQLKCPTCESTLVIETDELSTVDAENDVSEDSSESLSKDQNSENAAKTKLRHSDSYSSIGSLTDSICTAYENKITRQANTDEKSLNTGNDKETKFASVTNLTSLLGGLLQSIKIDSNKSLMMKAEETSHFLGHNIQYSYTDFSSVDHRIKLHILLNIFEHENEELILLLRADILMRNMKDPFPGCFVLSTLKVYVLQIDGLEGEDPQRWLHKEVSWTIDRLRSIAPLPFKQGVLIELEQPNRVNDQHPTTIQFLCILQDFQRTSNFLFYVTDMSLPPSCEVEFAVPEHCTASMQQLLKDCKNHQDGDTVRLLALFCSGSLKCQNAEVQQKLSSLILTTTALVICNMHWLLPGSKEVPHVIKEQPLSNVIGLEHNNLSLTFNFLDEIEGQEESWTLDFVSVSAAETVINSIRPPWEELFSIPLQITSCKTRDTIDT
ncbi:serine/threonine-protein kinase 11-interacting protein isoform X3 [Lasioglossum baleicum]|uniref:serine/threonine-protein kinase 11-interacting protein isoform X3 n=1 Tax=Lasioglossum baleicum TaxID=434251 RepID=UPI003FCDEE50